MNSVTILLASAILGAATPATAATVAIMGSRENVNPLSAPGSGRCAPTYFNTVTITPGAFSSTGISDLGTFTSTQSHCIASLPPTAVLDGLFTYNFGAGDTLFGTYTGSVSLSGTPGLFQSIENLIVTGGSGRFAGTTGTMTTLGSIRFAPNPMGAGNIGIYAGALSGTLNLAVPEPATWAMMIAGFGLVGGAMRRRGKPTLVTC